MNKFNYFKVLSKDDKELVHSSFISFLLKDTETSEYFLKALFPEFKASLNKESVELEKKYKYQIAKNKKKQVRIDIQAFSEDWNTVLFIENKFKSFPYKEQLDNYDKACKEHFPDKRVIKYLLCFDKKLINFEAPNWAFISYKDLLGKVNFYLESKPNIDSDKLIFISHYYHFLAEYFEDYKKVKGYCSYLFYATASNENKFWIRLINHLIRIKFENYFKENEISVRFVVNPSQTSTPLIEFYPKHWNKEGHPDIMIQFQGNKLKFYCHSGAKADIEPLVRLAEAELTNAQGTFKKMGERESKSAYIYQDILKSYLGNSDFGVDELFECILKFYKTIDDVAKKRFFKNT